MKNVIIRYLKYALYHIMWKNRVRFHHTALVSRKCEFEGANQIYERSLFIGKMGYGSYISRDCWIIGNIGRFTSIAPSVKTHTGIHPTASPFATTCPMFYSTLKQNGKTFANRVMFNEDRLPTNIGNDVWIGENVFFSAGLNIGDGAVVLAGAVVTKDVPPYAIVGGVPAKIVKYRYDENTIRFLLDLKWWNKDISWLSQNWELFCDIEKLKFYFSNTCSN